MSDGTGFEAYLVSKKIDSQAFRNAEPDLWEAWKREFEEMHPNSFTVQKLNLINPIRRKYLLADLPDAKSAATSTPGPVAPVAPKPGKPVMKPRPKMD